MQNKYTKVQKISKVSLHVYHIASNCSYKYGLFAGGGYTPQTPHLEYNNPGHLTWQVENKREWKD